jgi:hypothetical protein
MPFNDFQKSKKSLNFVKLIQTAIIHPLSLTQKLTLRTDERAKAAILIFRHSKPFRDLKHILKGDF